MEQRIEVENLYKVFGPHKSVNRAIEMSREGSSRDDIVEATGNVVAVQDVTMQVNEAEIFVIMGLSGSGKSTLLRCINRLIEPSSGSVRIDGDEVLDMERKALRDLRKRKTAMVFQHFGLLEHRTVLENAAFGLELQKIPQQEREDKARKVLKLVGLEANADAMVNELSGGMQQRVGLARALATEAEILLMDEAFSALDPLIRTRMQTEFLELQQEMPKTILFITHDLGEALSLGDRIAIMKDGAIVQVGGVEEIIMNPANDYVASFVENVDRSRVFTVETAAEERQPKISAQDSVQQAIETMERMELPYAFVMKDNEMQGAVRLRDAEREAGRESPSLEHIMLPPGKQVAPDETILSILSKTSGTLAPLPVVDNEGMLVGAVTKDMLLETIAGEAQ